MNRLRTTISSLTAGLTMGLLAAALAAQGATLVWTNTASGGWNTAANWSPNVVPGPSDVAVITNSGVTVSLNGGTTVAGVILGTNGPGVVGLALGGQTLALNGPFTVGANGSFTVDGGALVGVSNAVLRGAIGWSAGFLGGTLTLAPGGTLAITTGNNHDLPNCTFTNRGMVSWNGGAIRGGGNPGSRIYNEGVWDSRGDLQLDNGYGGVGTVFGNSGTLRKSASAGGFTIFHAGVFVSNTGHIDSQTNFIYFNGGGAFTGGTITNRTGQVGLNAGAFNLRGTVTSSNVQFTGSAALTGVNLIQGSLTWVAGSWNNAGSITIASNTVVHVLTGNNHDIANTTITNLGTLAWSDGAIRGGGNPGTAIYNLGVWISHGDLTMDSAYGGNGVVFNNTGTFRKAASAGGFTLIGAGVVFNNTGRLDSQINYVYLNGGGSFTGGEATNAVGFVGLNAGAFTLNGTVTSTHVHCTGSAQLTGHNVVTGGLTWVAGSWNNTPSVTIAGNSVLVVASGNDHNLANCAFTNHGTVVWLDGAIRGGGAGGTIIDNLGLWDAQSDRVLNGAWGGVGMVFRNRGTFRKSAGAPEGSTLLPPGVFFEQPSGAVDVRQGNVVLQGGGSFRGGVVTNTAGNVYLSAGGFNLAGVTTGPTVIQNAASLVGTNMLRGALTWVAGTWNDTVTTIAPDTTVFVAGGGGLNDLARAVVTNHGTVKWLSGTLRGGGTGGTAVFNHGLWDAAFDGVFNNGYLGNGTAFHNRGTLRKSAGSPAGSTVFSGVLLNQLAGDIDVRGGNLVLQGGGSFTGGSATNDAGALYLSVGGFTINGTRTGANVIENAGSLVGVNVIDGGLVWMGGVWNDSIVTLRANSVVTIAGGGGVNDLARCTVTNHGTIRWTSGQLRGGGTGGTAVHNQGLWDCQGDHIFNNGYGGNGTAFYNSGILRKSGGSPGGSTVFNAVFLGQLAGALDSRRGNLVFQGGGSLTGGTATNSSGAVYLSVGGFTLNGLATGNTVYQNAGSLVGANVIDGGLVWVAGSWNDTTVSIGSGSTVTIAGGGGVNDLARCTVTNRGTVRWSSGTLRGGGAAGGTTVRNEGLWEALGDWSFNNAYGGDGTVFHNQGTFRKSGATGSTAIQVAFNNTGTLDAQNGDISLQGGYTLAHGTAMRFGLGGAFGNGSISLPGAAAFAGRLTVNLNQFFWPAPGSSFNLLNYGSRTGVLFTNAVLPAGLTWATNYNPSAFNLSLVSRNVTNSTPTNIFISKFNTTNLLVQWPGDRTGWRVQAQTNPLSVGISTNWVTLPGSTLTNQLRFPINKSNGTVFFRMAYP